MQVRNPRTARHLAMTAPTTLDDDQVERLSQLLDQRAVPFKGFNLEALDGFLSALVVAPDTVPRAEWQPVVWGGNIPRWDGDDEALAVQALLLGHWNMAAARVRFEGDELPDYLAPLLWLPEELEVEQDDELDVGRDWAFGFFRGVELREAAWDAWLDLSKEPLVLTMPNTNGVYYQLTILSAWTNVLAAPGKRTTCTGGGNFLIAGPGDRLGKQPHP